jgi:O-antigen ligase
MNNNLIKMLGSKQGLTGLLMFLLPFLSLVTRWGVGLCSFLFLLGALACFKDSRSALARQWPAVRWVAAAFLFNFLFAAACLVLRPEADLGSLEKPSRMFFAISALALVLAWRPDRKMLWWGVSGGALGGALLVGYQRAVLDLDRPGGLMNAITTGDMLLCLGLISLAAVIDRRDLRRAALPIVGMLAGLAGTIITGTRGGSIALVLAALLLLRYSQLLNGRLTRALVLACFALVAATYFVPATGVRERVAQGVTDVNVYLDGGSAFSNVGIRLELWRASALLIADAPLLGVDPSVARKKMEAHIQRGELDPVVLPAEHFHNDALQGLVIGGVPGLFAWLAILAAPFAFFARQLRAQVRVGRERVALALAGMLVVICFFSFGLTEVIFWSVKASMFYALTIFLLMGLCLNAKENDGK